MPRTATTPRNRGNERIVLIVAADNLTLLSFRTTVTFGLLFCVVVVAEAVGAAEEPPLQRCASVVVQGEIIEALSNIKTNSLVAVRPAILLKSYLLGGKRLVTGEENS